MWTDERVDRWRDTGEVPGPVMVWTPAHLGAFLDHAAVHDPDLYPVFHLIAHCGLRRGEAVGLLDVEVALDRAQLTVSHQIVTLGHRTRGKLPKSEAGNRTVALAAATVEVLRASRARRPDRRDRALFFVRPGGQAWHPNMVSRRFRQLVAAAGLPPIRLHDLRHGAATLALAAGVDLKVVQATLGHSSLALTADTYTSVLPDLSHAAAEAVAALVPRRQTDITIGPSGSILTAWWFTTAADLRDAQARRQRPSVWTCLNANHPVDKIRLNTHYNDFPQER